MCKLVVMDNNRNENNQQQNITSNNDQQAIDKAPGEERGKGEQVTTNDLKGKKVDADPDHKYEQPINQLP
jgi:hypothetical protein